MPQAYSVLGCLRYAYTKPGCNGRIGMRYGYAADGLKRRVIGRSGGRPALQARNRHDHAGTRRALDELKAWWKSRPNALQADAPHESMNRGPNIWNLYQNKSNVLFSRFASLRRRALYAGRLPAV